MYHIHLGICAYLNCENLTNGDGRWAGQVRRLTLDVHDLKLQSVAVCRQLERLTICGDRLDVLPLLRDPILDRLPLLVRLDIPGSVRVCIIYLMKMSLLKL